MAKNRKYSHWDDMRGKLGRLIVSKNRYGSFTYEMPEYNHKSTKSQVRTQVLHAQAIKLWQTLSPKEIQNIDMYAADPAVKSMCRPAIIGTGYSLLYYMNRNLQEIGEPMVNNVNNLSYGVQHIYDFRVEIKHFRNKQGLRLFVKDKLEENTKLIVYATHSVPGGRGKPNDSWFRIIGFLDSKFKSGSYITADYFSIFKSIDTDAMSIFFRFKAVDKRNGLASNPEISTFTLSIKEKS